MNLIEKLSYKLPVFWVALPVLLIVFIPRPPIGGAQYLTFPILVAFCVFIILNPSIIAKEFIDLDKTAGLLLLLLSQCLIIVFSQLYNADFIRTSAIITYFRPILLIVLFLLGLRLAKLFSSKQIKEGLYFVGVIIIIGQLLISITQIFDIPIFDLIYDSEKARGIGSIFRVTGSLLNPNIFGFIIIQASLIVFLFGRNRSKFIWLGFAAILILVSGSRSQLLIFPFSLFLAAVISQPKMNFKFFFKSFLLVVIGMSVLLTVIYLYSDTFRYMTQLFLLIEGFDLTAINSLVARFEMWQNGWNFFLNDYSSHKWWIGLGSREELRVADNDFFYVLWHYGLIGISIHLMTYFILFFMVFRSKDRIMRAFTMSTLVLLFILGIQSETLSAWLQPLTIIYFIGLANGVKVNSNRKEFILVDH